MIRNWLKSLIKESVKEAIDEIQKEDLRRAQAIAEEYAKQGRFTLAADYDGDIHAQAPEHEM